MNNTKNQKQPTSSSNLKQAAQKLASSKLASRRNLLKILVIFALALLILLVVTSIFVNLRKKTIQKETSIPVPTITVTPPLVAKPTHPVYALDPTILELEAKVRALDQELISADIEEPSLNPPSLDLNVNFDK